MKKIVTLMVAGALFSAAAHAQSEEEDYTVVLPDAAQQCILPAAPDAIAPDAEYDRLVAAKGEVAEFQTGLGIYRECLQEAEEGSKKSLTPGNKQALVASYNYSVEMEERVAQRFNDAIRSYKERTAAE